MVPRDQVLAAYSVLSPSDQAAVLADFAHQLTIWARSFYVPYTSHVTDPAGLGRLNDVQNHVLGHLHQLLIGDPTRYADDEIVSRIIRDDSELLERFFGAIQRCGWPR